MTIAAHTLGCKLNFAETSSMLERLRSRGHQVVDFGQVADLYIINTCTVTATSEKKCRTAIRQAHRLAPQAQIAVVGCFAQVDAEALKAIEGVTYVLGNDTKHLLPELIDHEPLPSPTLDNTRWHFEPQWSGEDRTRTFFKIQDGCDYFCTYCAIPFSRGRSRSATVEQTLQAAKKIAATGAKEVVLTGVNTGTFGQEHGQTLLDLLQELDKVEGILRYRISSIEPNLLTSNMLQFIASSRAFLPHFHIPLQAGSDHVLGMMHRRYTTAQYSDKLHEIKSLMPDACIAADVIAGFNGEGEAEFAKVLSFIESLPISYLHVFTYSERPHTAALRQPEKVDMHTRRQHTSALLTLSQEKHRKFVETQMHKSRPVLWESTLHNGSIEGWTDNYIRLQRPYDAAMVGQIEEVTILPSNLVQEIA